MPPPPQISDDKPAHNYKNIRQTLKENHIDSHPPSPFMQKEKIPDDNCGQSFAATCCEGGNNACGLEGVEGLRTGAPYGARDEDD
jgi:hypothetical protein